MKVLGIGCFIISALSTIGMLIHFILWFCNVNIATQATLGQCFFIWIVSSIFGLVISQN
jgi:hypothetical protein